MRFLFAFVVALAFVPKASFSATSAKDKAEKQKKLLQLGAIVSAGAGIYLLAKKCNPSNVPKECPDPSSGAANATEPAKGMAVVDKILAGVPATLAFSQSFLCSPVLSALTVTPVALAQRPPPSSQGTAKRIMGTGTGAQTHSGAIIKTAPQGTAGRIMGTGTGTQTHPGASIRTAPAQPTAPVYKPGLDAGKYGDFAPSGGGYDTRPTVGSDGMTPYQPNTGSSGINPKPAAPEIVPSPRQHNWSEEWKYRNNLEEAAKSQAVSNHGDVDHINTLPRGTQSSGDPTGGDAQILDHGAGPNAQPSSQPNEQIRTTGQQSGPETPGEPKVDDPTAEAAVGKAKDKPCTGGKGTIGCILGPVAIGAAVMMYMKSREMGKVEDQFSGGAMANGGSTGGSVGGSGSSSSPPVPVNARGEPEDMAVPCPDNPQETCVLTDGGRKIVSRDGSYVETAQVAASIPNTPETQMAMQEATRSQQAAIAKAQAIDPNFQPALGTSSTGQGLKIASLPPTGTGPGGSSPGGSPSGGAAPGAASSFAGGGVGYGAGGENALYSQFAGGVVGGSGGGPRDNDRGYGRFAGSSGDDSFDEQKREASGLRGFFSSFGGRKTASSPSPEEHSIPFGNTRVGAAHTNIFSLAQDRYLTLRNRGEFYEGPVTPMLGGRQ